MKHCLVRLTVTLLSAYQAILLMTDKHERFDGVAVMGQCSLGFQAGLDITSLSYQRRRVAPDQPGSTTARLANVVYLMPVPART